MRSRFPTPFLCLGKRYNDVAEYVNSTTVMERAQHAIENLNPEGFPLNLTHATELCDELENFVGTPAERIELLESARPEIDAFAKIAGSLGAEAEVLSKRLEEAYRMRKALPQ